MPKRLYDLPSMHALVCFEAAARHQGFKAAASELHVTSAAISHQVKSLEIELGRELFRRYHRGVELTESGAYLLLAVQRGFEGISDSIGQLRTQQSQAAVTISATTAVSSLWLTPKLSRFWRHHGHVSVAQIVSDVDTPRSQWDLSIKYGDIHAETMACRALMRDRIIALGSPRFAEEQRIQSLDDLQRAPLIHLEAEETGWTGWQDWFAQLGYTSPRAHGFSVNNYIIALQAAQDDMGAILGWEGLTTRLVETGKLVQLVPQDIPSPLDFYIRINARASGRAMLLCDWLLQAPDPGLPGSV
ncbi:LysR substrate-binding domain-containing protein [Halomonas halmophila]|uniref:LysR family transcriptional regulator n=1 Tax=Halomonas halmophila TaxID=252 RepID=A0A4Y4F7Q7_9GAMM|nr:LysR substrate-binding domain-containing protein [Halomonas halmophila]GED23864.1 LysR family transcriptional regulator [Halomonas halmophila]